jgi:hypothetical protein
MLYRKFLPMLGGHRMHIPEITCSAFDNLPMLFDRGETMPTEVLLLADHSPFGLFDSQVLSKGRPFRIVLLREPLDRFESYLHFCAREHFIPEEWVRMVSNLPAMPESLLVVVCRFFNQDSGLPYWFDPLDRDYQAALENLLSCDVIAPWNDFARLRAAFNSRNPYGVVFEPGESLHLNHTPRSSTLTEHQREIVIDCLADEVRMWEDPALQRILTLG